MKTAILLAVLLTGCGGTIPATFLKNDSGQVVRCGGNYTQYKYGVLPGFPTAQDDADNCVGDYTALGYKVTDPKAPKSSEASKPTASLAVCDSLSTPEVRQKCVDKVEGKL